jgi:rod shape-determining protein MreC
LRNILLFIRHNFAFFWFLALQVFCMYLITTYNKNHHAVFSNFSNNITGGVNKQVNKVTSFITLQKVNDSLMIENERLYNQLKLNYQFPDTASRSIVDTIKVDSIYQFKRYTYMGATVISNLLNTQSNYIVLNRGSKTGVKKNMGVVDVNTRVVGRVVDVNEDYAIVMGLMHKDSRLSGKLIKTGKEGSLNWDGKEINSLALTNIPKADSVKIGDTIVSSGYSLTFPKGLVIGYVTRVAPEQSSNTLNIKLQTATDFYNLQKVFLINDRMQEPVQNFLESATPKSN